MSHYVLSHPVCNFHGHAVPGLQAILCARLYDYVRENSLEVPNALSLVRLADQCARQGILLTEERLHDLLTNHLLTGTHFVDLPPAAGPSALPDHYYMWLLLTPVPHPPTIPPAVVPARTTAHPPPPPAQRRPVVGPSNAPRPMASSPRPNTTTTAAIADAAGMGLSPSSPEHVSPQPGLSGPLHLPRHCRLQACNAAQSGTLVGAPTPPPPSNPPGRRRRRPAPAPNPPNISASGAPTPNPTSLPPASPLPISTMPAPATQPPPSTALPRQTITPSPRGRGALPRRCMLASAYAAVTTNSPATAPPAHRSPAPTTALEPTTPPRGQSGLTSRTPPPSPPGGGTGALSGYTGTARPRRRAPPRGRPSPRSPAPGIPPSPPRGGRGGGRARSAPRGGDVFHTHAPPAAQSGAAPSPASRFTRLHSHPG